jgi:hypothetical protein
VDTATVYTGSLFKQNPPAIFLQHSSPMCVAVSSAVTFGIASREFLPSIALVGTVVFVVNQPPLDGGVINRALYEFTKKIAMIKEVIALTYEKEREVVRIWTFIEKRDKQVRRNIYNRELELMDAFPTFTFDFNVVSLERLSKKPLIPDDLQGYLVFYRGC